jgi:hypothetical protein
VINVHPRAEQGWTAECAGRAAASPSHVAAVRSDCAGRAGRHRHREVAGSVDVLLRRELDHLDAWRHAFTAQHKDRRYFEIVEDTIHPEFDYRYFAIRDGDGLIRAIQPFFIVDQDLLAGLDSRLRSRIDRLRIHWPRFMRLRTLMLGCAAGEGHLDGDGEAAGLNAEVLTRTILAQARAQGARLIVLKEFPRRYRTILDRFVAGGFTRIPSMPMTRLSIAYADFDSYMRQALNSATRRKLRKKFAAADRASPIAMSVVTDIAPFIDEVYPLYLQVYRRSRLRFERLTKEYFCELGRRMPDKARFFIWRQDNRIVAFGECLVHGDTLFAEYLGLDYGVALDLHLYHHVYRCIVSWAIANGYRWLQSTGLNYDPKLHLRHRLEPIDLYVRGTSKGLNLALKWLLPLIEPTRYDETLRKFANYAELWDE